MSRERVSVHVCARVRARVCVHVCVRESCIIITTSTVVITSSATTTTITITLFMKSFSKVLDCRQERYVLSEAFVSRRRRRLMT